MTRPLGASQRFVAQLPPDVQARLVPVYSPLLRIAPLNAVVAMSSKDAAIFSSVNGVDAAPDGAGRKAYCIGKATTAAATLRGWEATQCGVDAQSLVATLLAAPPAQRLFHLSGRHTRGDIAGHLTQAGLTVERVVVYDQHLCDLTPEAIQAIDREKRVLVPLFSPRTAAQFVSVAPRTISIHIVALSQAVADATGGAAFAGMTIAQRPDATAMGIALAGLV